MLHFEQVTFENFMGTVEKQERYFGTDGMTLITGDNGAGKSTVIEAILFALYGQTYRKSSTTDLINKSVGRNMAVTINFIFNGNRYRIERYQKHKTHKNSVYLFLNDEPIKFKHVNDVKKYVEKNIVEYDILIRTIIFPQQAKDTFIHLTNKEMFNVFTTVANLSRFDEYSAVANTYKNGLKETVDSLNVKIETSTENINKLEELLKNEQSKWEVGRQAIRDKIKVAEEEIETRVNELKNLGYANVEKLNEDIQKANDIRINAQNRLNDMTESYNSRIQYINDSIVNKKAKIENDRQSLVNRIKTEINEKTADLNTKKAEESQSYFGQINDMNVSIRNKEKEANDKKDKIREEYDTIVHNIQNNKIGPLNIGIADANATYKNRETEYNKLYTVYNSIDTNSDHECIYCGRPLDESCKNALNIKLNTLHSQLKSDQELVSKLQAEKQQLEDKMLKELIPEKDAKIAAIDEAVKTDISSIEKIITSINNSIANINKKYDDMIKTIDTQIKSQYVNNFNEFKTSLENADVELNQLLSQLATEHNKEIETVKASNVEVQNRLNMLNSYLTRYNERYKFEEAIKSYNEHLEEKFDASNFFNGINNEKTTKAQLEEERDDILNNKYLAAEYWSNAFSDTGIKNFLVGKIIPYMNTRVNEYLKQLGTDYLVKIDNIKELKGQSKTTNKMSICILRNGYELPCNMLSGGEGRLLDILIFFVLYEIIAQQNAIATNVIFFDEILDSLDAKRIPKILKVMSNLASKSQVILISHESNLIDQYFNDTIRIEKQKERIVVSKSNSSLDELDNTEEDNNYESNEAETITI